MKKSAVLFFVIMISIPLFSRIQVYDIPNTNQKDLYAKITAALAAEPGTIITLSDQANFTIIAKGRSSISFIGYPMFFSVKIEAKDNRIRISYDNIAITNVPGTIDITHQFPPDAIDKKLAEYDERILYVVRKTEADGKDW